jgi:capsular exopolysaccharide synthesis family protein
MSQIDRALNRARHGGGLADRVTLSPLNEAEPQIRHVDGSVLEDYASEIRRGESPAPRVHPTAAPAARKTQQARAANYPPWLQGKLVVDRDLNPTSAEQYRRLGATLHGLQSERGLKTLMVSSTVPQEGKSLTVINLALTFSESYNRRVLVLDADLRRPTIHEAFGLPNARGLADVIRDGTDDLPLIEVAPNLVVLTAGRITSAAPMAELASQRLPALVKKVLPQFDWILIDTPPTGLFPDARLVAKVADAVLFVIGAGLAPYHLVQRAIAELGDLVIGTVLNRVDESSLMAPDYYGARYHRTTPHEGAQ